MFDWIVASDILYDRTVYPLLIETLSTVCGPATQVLLVNKTRHQGGVTTEWEHEPFLQQANDAGYQVFSRLVKLNEVPALQGSVLLSEADDVHGRADAPLLVCRLRRRKVA